MLNCSVMEDSATPRSVARQAPLSMGILQARILEWVVLPSSRGSSWPRGWTQVFLITGRFFTIWATREAQEYWNGSLSLLQDIVPTQESNRSLLHCRWILYQLSHQESPPTGAQLLAYPSQTQDSPSLHPRLLSLQGCGSSPGQWALRGI